VRFAYRSDNFSKPRLNQPKPCQDDSSQARESHLRRGFGWFNRGFEKLSERYANLTRRLVAAVAVVLVIYVALIGVAGWSSGKRQRASFQNRIKDT